MSSTISTFFAECTIDKREVEMILAHVLATTRAYVIAHHERTLDEPEADLVHSLIARRATGEPHNLRRC